MRTHNAREIILDELINGNGAEISSEKLCARLGMTRAAIWKHVEQLRQDGWDIKALPRRGYRLEHLPDLLHPACVRPFRRTASFASAGYYFPAAKSTGAEATLLAEEGEEEALVLSDMVTATQDRYGSPVPAESGKGIYMSIMLRPKLPPHKARLLGMMGTLAMVYAIEDETAVKPKIAWPADVCIGDKLLGGVSVNIRAADEKMDYAVISFWLNAAQGDMPDGSGLTSIKMLDGEMPPRALITASIIDEFGFLYENLFLQEKDDELLAQLISRTDIIGRKVKFQHQGAALEGSVADIDADGFLSVLTPDRAYRVSSGKISIIQAE